MSSSKRTRSLDNRSGQLIFILEKKQHFHFVLLATTMMLNTFLVGGRQNQFAFRPFLSATSTYNTVRSKCCCILCRRLQKYAKETKALVTFLATAYASGAASRDQSSALLARGGQPRKNYYAAPHRVVSKPLTV